MDRVQKIDLLQRVLAIKHKIKVHDSMPRPDTHEQIAHADVARWELEDELYAIEDILRQARAANVAEKKAEIIKSGPKKKKLLEPIANN